MPFNINSFKSHIDDNGYLKSNQFEVIMNPPPILLNAAINNLGTPQNIRNITDGMRFRIEQVRAPGINLLMTDINRYGVGPTQKQPFNAHFTETNFSILVDGYGEIWQYWYHWLRTIFEFNGTESARTGDANRIPTYTTRYKSEYSTIMQIIIYDPFGNAIQRVNLYEAFPTALREIPLAWNDAGNLMRLNVTVAYTDYTIVGSALEGTNPQAPSAANSQRSRTVNAS
jgi:hypothetical protein